MGRRGKAKFLSDGVLVVNKPQGPTSHDVVDRLRRRFKPAKLGHAGTLDPFATGVLVLAFNQATRLSEILGAGVKTYQGVLQLGTATETGDPTGEVVEEAPVPELDEARVAAVLAKLEGDRLQAPPAYSAAKHQGKPLYAYARQGVTVEKPPRPITIHEARLDRLEPGSIGFTMRCSRGTYVRSLAEDVALALGTVGHLARLCRAASAPFGLEEALSLDEALDLEPEAMEARLLEPSEAMARCGLAAVTLDAEAAWGLRQGRILDSHHFLAQGAAPRRGEAFRVLDPEGGLAAVLRWVDPAGHGGREYETIRVFPERSQLGGERNLSSASAMGAE